MRRLETRLGLLERAVAARLHEELCAFLDNLEAQLDQPTFERVLEITARWAKGSRVPLRRGGKRGRVAG
jgi:hypothetical protein